MTTLKLKLQAKWIMDRTEGIGPKPDRGPLDRCRLTYNRRVPWLLTTAFTIIQLFDTQRLNKQTTKFTNLLHLQMRLPSVTTRCC